VRFEAPSAFRMAVTWFFTVASARSSRRQIALLLLPSIINASTSACRPVRPRSLNGSCGFAVGDFDADGNEDLILSQNCFGVAPFEARQDAGIGAWLRGDGFTGDCGITIYYSVGARLENIDVAEFHKGIHIGIWTKDITVSHSKIHDNKYGMAMKSPEKKPEHIVLSHNTFYRNVKDIDKSSLEIIETDNIFKK